MTPKISENGKITLSHMNVSGYIGHATICNRMLTIAWCLVVEFGRFALGLDLVFGWLVVMRTYLHYVFIRAISRPWRRRIRE